MEPRDVIRRVRERANRGATFVEYALLGGLLALASLASLQFLIDTTEQGFEQSLNDVGTPIEATTPLPGDPGGGGGGGGGGSPDPTTPGPGGGGSTSTTQATTSTTQATTTTTISTKTPAWSGSKSTRHGSNWRGEARITLYDQAGTQLRDGAVQVRISWGSVIPQETTVWVSLSGGAATIRSDQISHYWYPSMTFTVVQVRDDGGRWNGQTGAPLTIRKP